jgi:hypothetical protein
VFAWNWRYLLIGAGLFVATFALSAAFVVAVLVSLPATFFLRRPERGLWGDRHPAIRWTGLVLKNLIGWVLIVMGLIMALPGVPGQGLLTILMGLVFADFPGKHRLERAILARPRVLGRINAVRARFGRPPLVLDE